MARSESARDPSTTHVRPIRPAAAAASRGVRRSPLVVLTLALVAACLVALAPLARGQQAPEATRSVVIHPFEGPELLLGTAVADRAAGALATLLATEVYGPLVAPLLAPPVPVIGGFINPSAVLGEQPFSTPSGVELLRSATGADLAAGGTLRVRDETTEVTLWLRDDEGLRRFAFEAPVERPERLAAGVARAIADRLEPGLASDLPAVEPFELSGSYGDYVRAVTLVGAGFIGDARATLAEAEAQADTGDAEPLGDAAATLLADLAALAENRAGSDPARMAVMALGADGFDEARAERYFEAFAEARAIPVADLWSAVLASGVNDLAGAEAAFDTAVDAPDYPYARLARAGFRLVNGQPGTDEDLAAVDAAVERGEGGVATLLGRALLAQSANDTAAETAALRALRGEAPFLTYPFERLSFLAFDRDDALAAAEALAVATELEPDSDLYWTNFGWALYLLGFVERSEVASRRAVALDPGQFIARYNLGLSLVVRGRLIDAMESYDRAVDLDPEIDDEAIVDLENALELYPDEPAIHYALGNLYEAEGRRNAAAEQFERYLARSAEPALGAAATRRLEALREPLPPIEVAGDLALLLGDRELSDAARPGDPLGIEFELVTPGRALPRRVEASAALLGADDAEIAVAETAIDIPLGAIGYVIDTLRLELPADLAAGDYPLQVRVTAPGDLATTAQREVTVEGEPQALRRLIGRGVTLRSLEGDPLTVRADLGDPNSLVERLLGELRATADAAEEALPQVETGRFEGAGGGELFRQSEPADVRDFLAFLLADGVRDTSLTFVDAYAQWALDGAPTP